MRVRMAAIALPMVTAGSTRLANDPAPETGSHPSLMAKSKNQNRPEREVGKRQAEQADDREQAVVPAVAAVRGTDSGGNGKNDRDEQRRQRELQRVGIALQYKVRHALVVAERGAEVAVQHAFPVADVLLAERRVEAVGVARGFDVGRRRAFAEHLLDGVSRHEMDEQEDEAYHQPDDWQGVEHALEEAREHRWFVVGRELLLAAKIRSSFARLDSRGRCPT